MSDDTVSHWEFNEVGDNEPMTDKELAENFCDYLSEYSNDSENVNLFVSDHYQNLLSFSDNKKLFMEWLKEVSK